ncbi:MAG TPA: O-antigen ligase family protein [Stenomitos sp.]
MNAFRLRLKQPPAGLLKPLLVALPFIALIVSAVVGFDRLKMVLLMVAPLMAAIFLNVELGIYVMLGFSTVLIFIKRMMPNLDANQIGLALEGMLVLMGMRLGVDLVRERGWSAFKTPITLPLLAFVGYQVVEVFNPFAPSLKFGLYGLRDTLRVLGVFLVLYYFRSQAKIKRLSFFWLGLLLFESLYGIFQHHHGILNQEYLWLLDSGSWRTHILNGYIRVFGTVGDAATFGFLMITGTLMLYGLALSSRGWKLWALLGLSAPMLYAMILSYSRGPIVAVVAGLGAMLIVSRNWKLAIGSVLIGSLVIGGLAAAGNTKLIDRVMTATKPSEDESFQVRMGYINTFLPRIVERPFGSGLWTSGASGLAVTGGQAIPGTTIGIPTDNNYFKWGLEMGYVGIAFFAWFMLTLQLSLIRSYARLKEPYLKATALGLFGVFTCYLVGALSNDIFVQKPLSEWLYIAAGLGVLLSQSRSAVPPTVTRSLPPAEGARGRRP